MSRLEPELAQLIYVQDYMARLLVSTKRRARHMSNLGYEDGAVMLESFAARVGETKDVYTKNLRLAIKEHPMQVAAAPVTGLNGIRLFRVLYYVDWEKAPTPASLWRYLGMGVTDGRSDFIRSMAYHDIHWSKSAGRAMSAMRRFICGRSSPYRPVYEARRVYEEKEKFHNARYSALRAGRYTTKMYLKHLWVASRYVYQLPSAGVHELDRSPGPEEFGWVLG